MSITVSTLQIYVSTGTLKIWSALPVPIIFIPIIDEVNTFAENLLRKINLNWRNDNFRKTTVMFQLSFYWLTITIYYEILITSLNKAIVCLNMCICLCFPLITSYMH